MMAHGNGRVTPEDDRPGMITTPVTADLLRGALDHEHTGRGLLIHRLPARARAQCSDPQLAMAESQPSGVRVAFRTAATIVELVALPTKRIYAGLPPRPDGIFDLLVDGQLAGQAASTGGTMITIDMAAGTAHNQTGPPGTVRFDGLDARVKTVEIWLPHNETIELVALRTDAPLERAEVSAKRVWVHHGSSISQGSNAISPSSTWVALAASLAELDVVNLGFGGSALLDAFVARTVRDAPADLISLEIGINIVNTDVMRLRAFTSAVHGFLDTIRDGHPTTPMLVISPLFCPIHEDTPGPGAFDPAALAEGVVRFRATGDPAERAAGKLTLTGIREELSRIVAQRKVDDPHLHYVDGRELYGESDFDDYPLADQLHPDADAHRFIGERFAARIPPG
jgi:hypothetical protein